MSVDDWVDELRRVSLYAILGGFESSDILGVGTTTFSLGCGAVKRSMLPTKRKVRRHVNENRKRQKG
ncbi:hypothetical protein F3157_14960 [Virgibacillus dakarensis]|nr:hypothetical protein [Virgibacillus dakarensis]